VPQMGTWRTQPRAAAGDTRAGYTPVPTGAPSALPLAAALVRLTATCGGHKLDVAVADEEHFGEMVRAARVARKIHLRTLAKQVGISASSLRDLEANRTVPSADVVREIGHALGLKMDDVLSAAGMSDDPEQYLQSNPYASALFRRAAEGRVEGNQLRQLSDAAERLERRRKKTKS